MDKFDVVSVGFIKGGVIDNEKAVMVVDVLLGLIPEWIGVRVEAMEQTGQGIMSSASRNGRLQTYSFRAAKMNGRSNQKIDVLKVRDFGFVHFTTILYNSPTP